MQSSSITQISAQNDTVSIALAVYNGAVYLPELLASLENQSVKPFELVVLDDCSSDDSLAVINAYPLSFPKRIYKNEKNSGPVFTFKKLAELCSGSFISFCDQDDVWLPKKIELSLSQIKKTKTDVPGLVFTDLTVVDENMELVYPSFWRIRSVFPDFFSFEHILYGNIVTGCTVVINQAMAKELIRMPVNIAMHDWWMALIAFGFGEHRFVNGSTVLYRSHSQSVTDKKENSFFKVFLREYKNRSEFLRVNILQAIEFRTIYADHLDRKKRKDLEYFIYLNKKSFFYKTVVRNAKSLKRRMRIYSSKAFRKISGGIF